MPTGRSGRIKISSPGLFFRMLVCARRLLGDDDSFEIIIKAFLNIYECIANNKLLENKAAQLKTDTMFMDMTIAVFRVIPLLYNSYLLYV